MKAEFKIAGIEDVEAIINLCNECFGEETVLLDAKKIFFHVQHDENQIYLVGYVNNLLVAHAKITIIPTIYKSMGSYAILNHVCVKEEYRRHEIATAMLMECERIARERGCKALKLWSMNFRVPAHKCYQKFGFEIQDAKFFSKEL